MTTGKLFYWVADWNLSRAEAELLLHEPTGLMIDCTSGSLNGILNSGALVNEGGPRRVAGYVTGTPDIRWTAGDWKRLPADCAVLRIDQSNSDVPALAEVRHVKDIELGASTEHTAITVARERLHAGRNMIAYLSAADLHGFEQLVARAGLPAGRIIAYQYTSPSQTPDTILPGTHLSLREANCDLSVILKSYLPLPDLRTPQNPSEPPAGHDRQWDDGYHAGYVRGYDVGVGIGKIEERKALQHG